MSLTPFKLFKGRKPILDHLKVWGCLGEVRLYNQTLGKLDSKTIRYYFVFYPQHSKGYHFYNLTNGTKIVDSLTINFLELDVIESGTISQVIENNSDVDIGIQSFLSIQLDIEHVVSYCGIVVM